MSWLSRASYFFAGVNFAHALIDLSNGHFGSLTAGLLMVTIGLVCAHVLEKPESASA